jgi:hypothetical protein
MRDHINIRVFIADGRLGLWGGGRIEDALIEFCATLRRA